MKQMTGATKDYKDRLAQSVSPEVYAAVCIAAVQILDGLPKDVPLGTLSGALMLAATAFAEGAGSAQALIDAKAGK